MTGRCIDQILPTPPAILDESYAKNALDYVTLAEHRNRDTHCLMNDRNADLIPSIRRLALDTNHRLQAADFCSQACPIRKIDDAAYILVGTRCFLGDSPS